MPRSKQQMLHNLLHGVGWGVFFATCFSAYTGLLYLIRGHDPFEVQDVTPAELVGFYYAGGVIVGGIVGLALPLARRLWGAVLVGGLAGIPVSVLFQIVDKGGVALNVRFLIITSGGVLLGAVCGWALWRIFGDA